MRRQWNFRCFFLDPLWFQILPPSLLVGEYIISPRWNKWFLTAFDLILAIANVVGFSPAVTQYYTSSRVRSFCCLSAIFSGVTCSKMETAFKALTSSSLLSFSSIIDCTAQLMFCSSCFRSQEIFVLLRHWSMASQTNQYEITSTSHYLSHSL